MIISKTEQNDFKVLNRAIYATKSTPMMMSQ